MRARVLWNAGSVADSFCGVLVLISIRASVRTYSQQGVILEARPQSAAI